MNRSIASCAALIAFNALADGAVPGTFWLSETSDVPGSRGWDAALPRICTYAVLAVYLSKTPPEGSWRTFNFWSPNTHLYPSDHFPSVATIVFK